MKVYRGKVHKYLGMTLDFSKKGKVKVSMLDYVKDVISSWDAVKEMKDVDGFSIILSKKTYITVLLQKVYSRLMNLLPN